MVSDFKSTKSAQKADFRAWVPLNIHSRIIIYFLDTGSIIVIFVADFWDEMPLGDLRTPDVPANIPGGFYHKRC